MILAAAVALAVATPFQEPPMRVGYIDYFGQTGVKTQTIRLPVATGDDLPIEKWATLKSSISDAVKKGTGKPATDVAIVGFDDQKRLMIFIGIAGPTVLSVKYRRLPGGGAKLDDLGLKLYKDFTERLVPALQSGGGEEDDSQGYSLFKDPQLREIQLKMRSYALEHGDLIRSVLETSTNSAQRVAASQLLGYARHSKSQFDGLMAAVRDPDETVRNNAVRALGVLMRSGAEHVRGLDPSPFIEMVRSGTWSDRNKGAAVLEQAIAGRDPKLSARVKRDALASLIEMARWQNHGHSYTARHILGRIAGIEEGKLMQMIADRKGEEIIATARAGTR